MSKKEDKKTSYKNIKRLILVPAVSFLLILGIGYYYFVNSIEDSTISSMKRVVRDHSQMIGSFLKERKADLEFVLRSFTFEQLSDPLILDDIFKNSTKNQAPLWTFVFSTMKGNMWRIEDHFRWSEEITQQMSGSKRLSGGDLFQ